MNALDYVLSDTAQARAALMEVLGELRAIVQHGTRWTTALRLESQFPAYDFTIERWWDGWKVCASLREDVPPSSLPCVWVAVAGSEKEMAQALGGTGGE